MEQNVQPDRTRCSELLNLLLCSLTVFERNVKIMHWSYQGTDFISVHNWLDTVHDDVCECIDSVAEEIRKGGQFPKATLNEALELSKVMMLSSSRTYGNVDVMGTLKIQIDALRVLADELSTDADKNGFWTIHDLSNDVLRRLNHHRYFVVNSIQSTQM